VISGRVSHVVRSRRSFAFAIFAAALICGAYFRFHQLGFAELTPDEAAVWAAASGGNLHAVIALQRELDPGKLAAFDIWVHGWIRLFGDSVGSLRASGASLGTLAIVLTFLTTRTLLLEFASADREFADIAAAMTALIFAVNPLMVGVGARILRMYPLVLVAELTHLYFFIRMQKRGGALNFLMASIFAALAVAANFTSAFLLLSEGLWLACVLLARRAGALPGELRVGLPFVALLMPAAIVGVPVLQEVLEGIGGLSWGFLNWRKAEPPWWPILALVDSAGSLLAFVAMVAAIGVGARRRRRQLSHPLLFLAFWLCGPMGLAMAVSYAITPMMAQSYVIASFVAFFVLAGIGIASVPNNWLRLLIGAVIVIVSTCNLIGDLRERDEFQWREAATLAFSAAAQGEHIGVVPAYAYNVVRYYLRADKRDVPVGLWHRCGSERLLILAHMPVSPVAMMDACYPHVLGQVRGIEIRTR
jgi:hypothetical protein